MNDSKDVRDNFIRSINSHTEKWGKPPKYVVVDIYTYYELLKQFSDVPVWKVLDSKAKYKIAGVTLLDPDEVMVFQTEDVKEKDINEPIC